MYAEYTENTEIYFTTRSMVASVFHLCKATANPAEQQREYSGFEVLFPCIPNIQPQGNRIPSHGKHQIQFPVWHMSPLLI